MSIQVRDACVQQWAVDLHEMKEFVSEKWRSRLARKSKMRDPISGALMPTIPWHHAFWNENSPNYQQTDPDEYTNSTQYRSPEKLDSYLESNGIDSALLTSHEMRFLPALPSPGYSADLAQAYNELIASNWLPVSDRFNGSILLAMSDPEAAAREIRKYAEHPKMASALIYGGGELPLGHDFYDPVYAAAAETATPLTIHVSGNPIHRQTAMGIPEHYVTHDTNLVHNHMSNLVSLIHQGVLDDYPDLEVVWAGQGVSWILQTLWRSTRYYRNLEDAAPVHLKQEPIEYLNSNCYVTTYPLGALPDETAVNLFEMVGIENIIYASGYPYWNADTVDALPELSADQQEQILSENAHRVYGL